MHDYQYKNGGSSEENWRLAEKPKMKIQRKYFYLTIFKVVKQLLTKSAWMW